MTFDWSDFQIWQATAFDPVRNGLGDHRVELTTASELAALMARLPANTPVVIADALRVDPRLQLDATPTRTIVVAEVVPLPDPTEVVQVDDDGDVQEHPAISPAVQLGAVIVAADASYTPIVTVPLPAYERAIEALGDGETAVALGSQVKLINWMADTLTTLGKPADDEEDDTDEEDRDLIPNPIDDPDLRAALAVEASRLHQAAGRLAALRARVADHEAIADVTDAAEKIIRSAAEDPNADDNES
jgi:hypothetical protein